MEFLTYPKEFCKHIHCLHSAYSEENRRITRTVSDSNLCACIRSLWFKATSLRDFKFTPLIIYSEKDLTKAWQRKVWDVVLWSWLRACVLCQVSEAAVVRRPLPRSEDAGVSPLNVPPHVCHSEQFNGIGCMKEKQLIYQEILGLALLNLPMLGCVMWGFNSAEQIDSTDDIRFLLVSQQKR